MKLSKDQASVIIGAVISLLITVLGVFGYNVLVVEPALQTLEQATIQSAACCTTLAGQ